MKTRTFIILLVVFFAVVLLCCQLATSPRWPGRVDVNFAVSLTLLAVGGLVSAVSLFALLQRGLNGETLDRSLPLIVALLGGLLLYQANWGIALALGMIGTAVILAGCLSRKKSD